MNPLVSVIISYYNALDTFPLALSSLLSQSFEDWECIIVDDGSKESPLPLIKRVGDPRVHYIKLNKNKGRGYARQIGLQYAKGQFIAFLDADDWMYPERLERQIIVMNNEPGIAMVSSGMAIVDDTNNIVYVRSPRIESKNIAIFEPFKKIRLPFVPFASSMFRAEIARNAGFDVHLRRSEDMDFLLRIINKYPFGILDEILYVYTEYYSLRLKDIIESYGYNMKVFVKFRKISLRECIENLMLTIVKLTFFSFLHIIGGQEKIMKMRSQKPKKEEIARFEKAREKVYAVAKEYFPDYVMHY